MYIRTTINTKGTAYYHLVESYRDRDKVKQRTLLSLGRVEDGKLEQLAEAISKHTDKISVFNMAKDIDVKDTYILGSLLVLERMMTGLGLSGCLSVVQSKHQKLHFDLKKVVFTQLCSRFVKTGFQALALRQLAWPNVPGFGRTRHRDTASLP